MEWDGICGGWGLRVWFSVWIDMAGFIDIYVLSVWEGRGGEGRGGGILGSER